MVHSGSAELLSSSATRLRASAEVGTSEQRATTRATKATRCTGRLVVSCSYTLSIHSQIRALSTRGNCGLISETHENDKEKMNEQDPFDCRINPIQPSGRGKFSTQTTLENVSNSWIFDLETWFGCVVCTLFGGQGALDRRHRPTGARDERSRRRGLLMQFRSQLGQLKPHMDLR